MNDPITSLWESQRAAMGAFIRSQREMSKMSLRELSRVTKVSNAYLSQVERGLHDPTLRVLVQIGDALHLSVEEILRQQVLPGDAGSAEESQDGSGAREQVTVEDAIAGDPVLTDPEKEALRSVYRSYLRAAAQRALEDRAAAAARPETEGSTNERLDR